MGYLGQEGELATADLLLGRHNLSRRLPITYPTAINKTVIRNPNSPSCIATEDGNAMFSEGVNIEYRWYTPMNKPVSFPFSFGLSYSAFESSGLRITPSFSLYGLCITPHLRRSRLEQKTEVSHDSGLTLFLLIIILTVKKPGRVTSVAVPTRQDSLRFSNWLRGNIILLIA